MRSARLAVTLAWLAAVIAVGQWVVFMPLLAMGIVNSDRLYYTLFLFAFFGWPLAGVAAAAAARLIERRPRAATALLVLVGLGLLYPFFVGGVVALLAAALAFRGPRTAAPERPGGWPKAREVSRALVVGVVAVVALVIIIPSVLSLAIALRSDDEPEAAAEAGRFESADDALRAYAESWQPPFLGPCPVDAHEGSCIEEGAAPGNEAIYRLCAADGSGCLTLRFVLTGGGWEVTDVNKSDLDRSAGPLLASWFLALGSWFFVQPLTPPPSP